MFHCNLIIYTTFYVLVLAIQISENAEELGVTEEVCFVTHECHKSLVDDLFESYNKYHYPKRDQKNCNHSLFQFIGIPSSPMCIDTTNKEKNVQKILRSEEHFHGCISATKHVNTIICNLFALEGFHLAEALNIPLIIISPALIISKSPGIVTVILQYFFCYCLCYCLC